MTAERVAEGRALPLAPGSISPVSSAESSTARIGRETPHLVSRTGLVEPGSNTVESYGDVAVERWERVGLHGSTRPRQHRPAVCSCIVCADGRALLGIQPFKPSPLALFHGWRAS